jgi:hypothetical protein
MTFSVSSLPKNSHGKPLIQTRGSATDALNLVSAMTAQGRRVTVTSEETGLPCSLSDLAALAAQ